MILTIVILQLEILSSFPLHFLGFIPEPKKKKKRFLVYNLPEKETQ